MSPRAKVVALASVAAALMLPSAAAAYQDLVLSPDGRNVYATGDSNRYSTGSGLTFTYSRDPSTGQLSPADDIAPGGAVMAISPDGRWVFVARTDWFSSADALDVLTRNRTTGELTLEWRIAEGRYGTINKPRGLAISPDGRHLYVSQAGPNALVSYAVNQDSGKLTRLQTFARTDLGTLGDIVASPDGKDVYVAPNGDGSDIVAFTRDSVTGLLTLAAQYPTHVGYYGDPGSTLAMSPDGGRLYVGSFGYGIWDRDPDTGDLSYLETVDFAPTDDHNTSPHDSVMATSPDGGSVFSIFGGIYWQDVRLYQAAATSDGATLERTYAESKDLSGLMLASRMRWSPDGKYAYLAGARHVAGYDSGEQTGIAVLGWDASSRMLSGGSFNAVTRPSFPQGEHPSVSIDDGALYTNHPDVTITFKPPPYAASFRLGGDTESLEDGPARRIEPGGTYRWRLDTTGAAPRDVRHVYLRVWTLWGDNPIDLSDDIVLDQTAPIVSSARVRRGKITVHAYDNRSGVKRMQVTRDRAKPGMRRRFHKRISLPDGSGRVWVRVFDGAHNQSRWRRAKRG